jgi:tetratricopeptide (TPR) repeat protein
VTAVAHPAPYTLKNIEEMLGLGRGVVAGLVEAGFVSPARGARNEYRFTFQDVVLLRTAHQLRAAKISTRKLLRSLQQLKAKLPDEAPLAGLRIRAIGNDVAVRNADAQWEADSGQLLMDFEVATSQGTVSFLERGPARATPGAAPRSADDWFEAARGLEATNASGAEAAYRHALSMSPGHADAAVNLGAMLCEQGQCAEAVDLFDRALKLSPESPVLHFNRGIALEDQHREAEAVQSYERCLALDPDFADAHYNAARLHELLGDQQGAVRHYSAYRRLHP